MINIAVIGTGAIAADHLKAIANSERCRLCAVCDINQEKANSVAEEYSVPYFTDYKDVPDAVKPDAVIINLPHGLHCESTVYFLEHGVHVLVEKPMANSVAECDVMLAAAEKSGKKLAVGHIQRFIEANRKVKEIIDSGAYGKLCMFSENRTVDYFEPTRPKWFLDKKVSGGGIVMNYGAHVLDKLFYILGTNNAKVTSCVGNYKNNAEIEGHAQFLLEFPNDISAAVTFSGYGHSDYNSIYYFTDAALKVENSVNLSINTGDGWNTVNSRNNFAASMAAELDEFCKYINDEPCNIADGIYSRSIISVIEKIYHI